MVRFHAWTVNIQNTVSGLERAKNLEWAYIYNSPIIKLQVAKQQINIGFTSILNLIQEHDLGIC